MERERADVVLCQEVARRPGFDAAGWLEERLGFGYYYEPANGDPAVNEEGLAILSRYPMRECRALRLTPAHGWQRIAIAAVVESTLGDLLVVNAHLSLRPWRNTRQVDLLRAWIEETAGDMTAVIGGDFNRGESAAPIRALQAAWIDTFRTLQPSADGATHALVRLSGWALVRRRLDYIFLRPGAPVLRVTAAAHVSGEGQPFSDHMAVVIRLAEATEPYRLTPRSG